jgi:hypothetical protein
MSAKTEWAVGHPEGSRTGDTVPSTTTVAAKKLIRAFMASLQKFSYWNSCHNGGNQGLSEAQHIRKTSTELSLVILPTM